jgi:glycosyltransferase involved in cell wall biosynthesis
MMVVSVIIPTLNEARHIKTCLHSLLNQSYPKDQYEVLVVDSDSTDGTIEIVKACCSKHNNVSLIFEDKKSASAARNKGIEMAKGKIIAFIDADTIISEGWIDQIIGSFDDTPQLGVVGGPDFTPNDDPYIARMIGLTENSEARVSKFKDKEAAMMIKSCNCGCLKEVLDNVGYFDEDVPPMFYFDETPLWLKMIANGYKAYFNPKMNVFHRRQSSVKEFLKIAYRYGASKAMLGYIDTKDILVSSVLIVTLLTSFFLLMSLAIALPLLIVGMIVIIIYTIKRFYRTKNFKIVLKNLPMVASLFYLKWIAWAGGLLSGFRRQI